MSAVLSIMYSSLIITLCSYLAIDGLFLRIGFYKDYQQYGINLDDCGKRYVGNISIDANDMNNKCFLGQYSDKLLKVNNETQINGGGSASQTDSRIFNGEQTEDGVAPWAVLLNKIDNGHTFDWCTGVLITLQWILTAAHCYNRSESLELEINAGTNRRIGRQQQVLSADQSVWIRHNKYMSPDEKRVDQSYDISLLKMPVKFVANITVGQQYGINAICLPQKNQTNEDTESVTFFGYGLINESNAISDTMLRAEMNARPYWECWPLMTCVIYDLYDQGESMACPGDSGGPLVQFLDTNRTRAVLLGTLIAGQPHHSGCSEKIERDMFSTISLHIDWVLETIKNN